MEDEEPVSVAERIAKLQAKSSPTLTSPAASPRRRSTGPSPAPSLSKRVKPPSVDGASRSRPSDAVATPISPTELSADRYPPLVPSPRSSLPPSPAISRVTSPAPSSASLSPTQSRPRGASSASAGLSLGRGPPPAPPPRPASDASASLVTAFASRSPSLPAAKPALGLVTANKAARPATPPRQVPAGANLIAFTPTSPQAANGAPWSSKVVLQPPSPDPNAAAVAASTPLGATRARSAPPLPMRKATTDPLRAAPSLPPRPRPHAHSASLQSVSLSEAGSDTAAPDVSPDAATKRYEALYGSLLRNGRASVARDEVAKVWARSRLDRATLRRIWTECDPKSTGQLSREAFVGGMARIDAELAAGRATMVK